MTKPKRKRIGKDDNTLPAPLMASDFFCLYETKAQAVFIDKRTGIIYEADVFSVFILTILDKPELLPFNFQNPLSPAMQKVVEEYFAQTGIHELMKLNYDLQEAQRVLGG